MESKYYIPKPEEFYFGFEYEQFENYDVPGKEKEWHKWAYGEHGNDNPENITYPLGGNMSDIRVKWLDKECIESTGWKYDRNFEHVELFSGMKNNREQEVMLIFVPLTNWVCIYNKERESEKSTLFAGEIKNKSELLRIMNMCKITKIETNEKD